MHFGFSVCRGMVAFGVAALVAGCGGGGGLHENGVTSIGDTVSTTRTVEGLRFTATGRAVYSSTERVAITLTVENPTNAPISYAVANCGESGPRISVHDQAGTLVNDISSPIDSSTCVVGQPRPRAFARTFAPGQIDTYTLVWNRLTFDQSSSFSSTFPTFPGTFKISSVLPLISIGDRQLSQTGGDANGNYYPAVGPDPLTVTVR